METILWINLLKTILDQFDGNYTLENLYGQFDGNYTLENYMEKGAPSGQVKTRVPLWKARREVVPFIKVYSKSLLKVGHQKDG